MILNDQLGKQTNEAHCGAQMLAPSSAKFSRMHTDLFVEAVDVAGLVQLLDEPRVDEIFRVGGFRGGNALRKILEDGFETVQGRIRLRLNEASQQLVSVLDFLLVLDLHALGQCALGNSGVGAHH